MKAVACEGHRFIVLLGLNNKHSVTTQLTTLLTIKTNVNVVDNCRRIAQKRLLMGK